MTERAAQLKLAVDIGSDPISGSVMLGEGAPNHFCGWIELVAAIESARHGAELDDDRVEIQEPAAVTGDVPAESALG